MAHPVNWFHIEAKDAAAQQAFYEKVFDWKIGPAPGGGAFIEKEAGGIQGGINSAPTAPAVRLYVGVSNLEEQLKRVEEAGGKQSMAPMDLPGDMGRIAAFNDPEGNFIGLWETKGAPPELHVAKRRAAPKKAAAKKPAPKKPAPKKATKKPAAKRSR